jgi:hypothetical protein
MTNNQHAPESLRLLHGMEHAGLSPRALEIERSRDFKLAFVNTISEELGFATVDPEIFAGREPGGTLASYLGTFGPDGHPPESETVRFVGGELVERGGERFGLGDQLRDCCIRWPGGWQNCGGYVVTKDGQPWTIESAVAEYESRHGKIADPAVRAELAAIRVYVQIEWEIAL